MHRLLWLTENYPPDRGGMSVSCDRIVRGLRRAGVHVDVVHLDRGFPDAAHTINTTWNRIRASASEATHVVAAICRCSPRRRSRRGSIVRSSR